MKYLLILASLLQLSCERRIAPSLHQNESESSAEWSKISNLSYEAIVIAEKDEGGGFIINFTKGNKTIVDTIGSNVLPELNKFKKGDKELAGYLILARAIYLNDGGWDKNVVYYPIRAGKVELDRAGASVDFIDLNVAKEWASSQKVIPSD